MLTDGQILMIVFGAVAVIMALLSIATAKVGPDADDVERLHRLTDEGRKKFPTLWYKEMIECMRWHRHIALKNTSDKNEIAELSEDYLVLYDELKRIEQEENQLGGEFAVFHKSTN